MATLYFALIVIVAVAAYWSGRSGALRFAHSGRRLHSLPGYHGWFLALCAILPMLAVLIFGAPIAERIADAQAIATLPSELQPADVFTRASRLNEIANLASRPDRAADASGLGAAADAYAFWHRLAGFVLLGLGLISAAAGYVFGRQRLSPDYRARNRVEQIVKVALIACAAVAVLTTVGIVFSVVFETLRFFARYPWYDFLFGLQWSPQTAIRADQVGQTGAFGAVPLFAGTALIMVIAMLVAGPVGLFSAIYMAEYASPRFRAIAKPALEVLAGVPTVVFGFFAALTIAPGLRQFGESIGLDVASESALAAGLVMGVMIIPFVSSLSDDVINAVPQSLRDGSYAMGATRSETIRKVVLPAALPGIVSAMMLAVSRAVGETMIVVMAAGLSANLTFNPLEAVTTVTVQIKTLLTGDQEFDSAKTLSAFALGFVLFFFTLALNFVALKVVQRYREQYD
jgi:phosphate transport system permease protein